mmetsp:Transcript_31261/g.71553  ORF Transcript_31261/g.71553 Transcript_31261/m.71553 type:complete len:142 (+) Transcript_31261:264-689(+)
MILRDGKTQPQWAERLLESVVHSQNTGRLIRRSGASLHPHSIESYRYGTAPIDTRIAGDTMRRFKRNQKHSGATIHGAAVAADMPVAVDMPVTRVNCSCVMDCRTRSIIDSRDIRRSFSSLSVLLSASISTSLSSLALLAS